MLTSRGSEASFSGVGRTRPHFFGRPLRASPLPRGNRYFRRPAPVSCSPLDRSYDSEDELNYEYLDELSGLTDPDKFSRFSKRMDLLWNISKRRSPEACDCCQGSGSVECGFCNGTGVLTIGDVVYCSMTGCKPCPVCNRKGTVECKKCKGTGKRAGWMDAGNSIA